MIGWSVPVKFAVEKLQAGSDDPLEIELAGVTKSETFLVKDLVKKLASALESQTEGAIQRKWLYLKLAWLFENRTDFTNPFDEIDKLYADFDYPTTIEHLVSFMPASDNGPSTQLPTEEIGTYRLRTWQEFLESEQRALMGEDS